MESLAGCDIRHARLVLLLFSLSGLLLMQLLLVPFLLCLLAVLVGGGQPVNTYSCAHAKAICDQKPALLQLHNTQTYCKSVKWQIMSMCNHSSPIVLACDHLSASHNCNGHR